MNFSIREALRTLKPGSDFRIVNEARPGGRYIFNAILPERNRPEWEAKDGSMKVITTAAGLVGMDSAYPKGGAIKVETFSEKLAKIAISNQMDEKTLRELHGYVQAVANRNGNTKAAIVENILNYYDKIVVQALMDRTEWLRSMALCTGALDWTFNKKRLLVDYGIPSGNVAAQDTSNDAWGGTASKFWTRVSGIRRALKGNVRVMIAHPDTIDAIRYNAVNSLVVTEEGDGFIAFRKVNSNGDFTKDQSDIVRLLSYGMEIETLSLTTPGETIKTPIMPRGILLGIGSNPQSGYEVGAGSTDDVTDTLGYTHVGPTVEGDFQLGRWGRVFTPEERQWSLEAEGVANLLPVITEPSLLARASTTL